MKTSGKLSWALAVFAGAILAINSGCVDNRPPPPVAVVGFVPDYYFWDGYEYVAWYDDDYYYWGSGNTWIICDPPRRQRVTVWVQNHPNWRTEATPMVQTSPQPNAPVGAGVQPRPPRPPRVRHGLLDQGD
jgi:hypothetical protein